MFRLGGLFNRPKRGVAGFGALAIEADIEEAETLSLTGRAVDLEASADGVANFGDAEAAPRAPADSRRI